VKKLNSDAACQLRVKTEIKKLIVVGAHEQDSMKIKPKSPELKNEYLRVAVLDMVVDLYVDFLKQERKSEFECSTNLCDIAVGVAH